MLWDLVRKRAAAAHASGAMYRIESEPFLVEDDGVEFVVRCATDIRAQLARMPRNGPGNPFEPPEEPLFVADVSPTHFALLNKYHVIESHLLVVTRRFVDQEVLLDRADFEALVACFPEGAPAIGFYNGGTAAGASQAHKHLQVVTLPLSPRAAIPMAPRLAADPPALPFPHAFARIQGHEPGALHACYRDLLAHAGVRAMVQGGTEHQSRAYNMLLGPGWMMVVPRSQERFGGVAVNSLAYLGAMFVRDEAQLAAVREAGPMAVLTQVASGPWQPESERPRT